MKKTFARFLTVALVLSLLVCCFAGMTVSAAESEEEYTLFIAYGGDKEAENDWGWQYYGTDVEGITATTATAKVGDTVTISLAFDTANVNSWFFAPCLVGENVTNIANIDFDITCKIDGQDVAIDMAADAEGKTWWTEGTGDYTGEQCIRLAGGYNEWATKYIAEPAGFSTIEYTITLNSIELGAAAGEMVLSESTEEYGLFIAYGGDKAAENDWGWSYDNSAEVEGITAVTATVKSGDTATISLTFDGGNVNSWYFAPCLVGTGAGDQIQAIDFTVVCKIDGVEVPIDMAADAEGKTFWAEGTGSYTANDCIRLAGGYNEWATKYIAEPAGFTTIEYTITFNSIQIGTATEVEEPEVEIDLNGTFNAYLLLQTPNWTFRDGWNTANGIGSEVWGQHITNNDSKENFGVVTDAVIAGNGTYTISITDFGTVFADDFAAAGQEYFNIIGISTDIPLSDKVQITNVQLIIDGQVRDTQDVAYQNPDTKDYYNILIQNIWNSDKAEIGYYPAPAESLEIQFTVSGLAYDNAEQGAAEPVETEPVADATEPATTAPAASEPVTEGEGGGSTGIIIAVVVIAVVAVAAVVVLKKKKAQ